MSVATHSEGTPPSRRDHWFANRWLWWKEIRLITPLLLMLIAIAVVTLFLPALIDAGTQRYLNVAELALLLFPILFAAGAGAVLVGQEREQRTMDWLATLPVSPHQLIAGKFLVAFGGLVLTWFVCIFLSELISTNSHESRWHFSIQTDRICH